jgi:hypothetical protein
MMRADEAPICSHVEKFPPPPPLTPSAVPVEIVNGPFHVLNPFHVTSTNEKNLSASITFQSYQHKMKLNFKSLLEIPKPLSSFVHMKNV